MPTDESPSKDSAADDPATSGLPAASAREARRDLEAAALAHDLVQPLGAICNFAELIKDRTDGEAHHYAERIREIAARAAAKVRERLGRPGTDEKS